MKTLLPRLLVCASALAATAAFAANDSIVTAVYSKVSNGYQRQKLADGSFKREHYALAKGVYVPGVAADRSIDAVRFPQVAKVVAQFLALQNYYLAPDAKSSDLLLQITWGKTVPFNDSVFRNNTDSLYSARNSLAMANAYVKEVEARGGRPITVEGIQSPARSARDAARDAFEDEICRSVVFEGARREANLHNARLLGYVDEINRREVPSKFGGAGATCDDLASEIEDARYYVILSAYDFRAAANKEEPKLLWTTRVSIQAQGNRFNETLAAMLRRASPFFGQESGRLVRQYEPDAKVILRDLQFLGAVTDSGAAGKVAPSAN